MIFNLVKYELGFLSLFCLLCCVSNGQKLSVQEVQQNTNINNTIALEANAKNLVEIEFNKGRDELTVSTKLSMNLVIEQAYASGKIKEVLVWSDEDFSVGHLKSLAYQQNVLATKRSDSIKKHIYIYWSSKMC